MCIDATTTIRYFSARRFFILIIASCINRLQMIVFVMPNIRKLDIWCASEVAAFL